MRPPDPLPDSLKRTGFSVANARDLGVPRKRLRSKELVRPYQGVRIAADAVGTTMAGRAVAYAPRMSPDQYFSHLTAAALLDMRTPAGIDRMPLHVTSILPRHAPRVKGVVGHEVAAAPTLLTDGSLLVSDRISTWLSLGAATPLDDLIVLGDGLMSRQHPYADLEEIRAALESSPIRRGRARLQRALHELRPNTDSAPETRLRLLIVRAGLPEPEVNGLVKTAARSYHGDLVFRDARVVVEYDGVQHRLDERQHSIDVDRLDHMMAADWRVIRVDRRLMSNRVDVLARIRTAVEAGDRLNRRNGPE